MTRDPAKLLLRYAHYYESGFRDTLKLKPDLAKPAPVQNASAALGEKG